MKPIRRWMTALALILAVQPATAERVARDLRNLPLLQQRPAGDQAPAPMLAPGRALLLVMDARLGASRRLLERLAVAGFRGEGALVMVLGDVDALKGFADLRRRLPAARWTHASHATASRQLGIATLPAIYGVAVDGDAAWKSTGAGEEVDELALRMIDWVASTPHAPAASE
jgi:hypothetical protein